MLHGNWQWHVVQIQLMHIVPYVYRSISLHKIHGSNHTLPVRLPLHFSSHVSVHYTSLQQLSYLPERFHSFASSLLIDLVPSWEDYICPSLVAQSCASWEMSTEVALEDSTERAWPFGFLCSVNSFCTQMNTTTANYALMVLELHKGSAVADVSMQCFDADV